MDSYDQINDSAIDVSSTPPPHLSSHTAQSARGTSPSHRPAQAGRISSAQASRDRVGLGRLLGEGRSCELYSAPPRPDLAASHINSDSNDLTLDDDTHELDGGTNPMAAASDLIECPNCHHSIGISEIADPGQEATALLSASFSQDGINEGQAVVDQETLNELKDVMSDMLKRPVTDKDVNLCKTNSIDPKRLLQFFKDLNAQEQKKSDKANSASSSRFPGLQYLFLKVKVFPIVTGKTFGADEAILEKVNKSITVQLTGLQECDLIIAFCPITSRVGSDMETAKNHIPGSKPAVLVLMHHTRDVTYATGPQRWSKISDNIELDVDVLFHRTQPGLLKCSRNNQAIQEIEKVFKKHSKRF